MREDFAINRGDTTNLEVVFTREDTVIDITDATVFFTAKLSDDLDDADDSDAKISKTITSHDDPTNGLTFVELSSTDTNIPSGLYNYDIQLKEADGTITSIARRKFRVNKDVTRRTS